MVKPPLLGRQNKNHWLILVKINHANHQGNAHIDDNKYSLALGKTSKALRSCTDLDLTDELSALSVFFLHAHFQWCLHFISLALVLLRLS